MNRLLVLTHADIKDPVTGKLEQVYVDIELIGMAFRMPTKGATAVTLVGGAAALVTESPEFVMTSKMNYLEANKPQNKQEARRAKANRVS